MAGSRSIDAAPSDPTLRNPIATTDMHTRCLPWAFLAASVVSLPTAVAQSIEPDGTPSEDQIRRWVRSLDAPQFSERREALRGLRGLPPESLPTLRDIADAAGDDVKRRLQPFLETNAASLTPLHTVRHPKLKGAVDVRLSPEDRFLYVVAFQSNSLLTFEIPEDRRSLRPVQSFSGRGFGGAIGLATHDDPPRLAMTAFRNDVVRLFDLDEATGKLSRPVDYNGDAISPSPRFPIGCEFSRDGRLVFVADPSLRYRDYRGGLMVLEVTADRTLQWIDTYLGDAPGQLFNARSLAVHPTQPEVFVTGTEADTLSVIRFDPLGNLQTRQVITVDDGGPILDGITGVTVSADGGHLYVTSGRFGGQSGVAVFGRDAEGSYSLMQDLVTGRDDIGGLTGGNQIVIAPDGRHVYATATISDTVHGFRRDPATGRLTHIESHTVDTESKGPTGIAVTADGRTVYVAVEAAGKIEVFRRD